MQGPLVLQAHACLSLTALLFYNTLDPDVALAYLPTATVTIAVVDMIMSLILDHEDKKLIPIPFIPIPVSLGD